MAEKKRKGLMAALTEYSNENYYSKSGQRGLTNDGDSKADIAEARKRQQQVKASAPKKKEEKKTNPPKTQSGNSGSGSSSSSSTPFSCDSRRRSEARIGRN